MRTAKFQDVLHAVARKAGYSPESGNFLTNQAIPIGEYITAWVDRLYTAEDWPEWVKVLEAVPGSDLSDGTFSLLDIADRAKMPFAQIKRAAERLTPAGLLRQLVEGQPGP